MNSGFALASTRHTTHPSRRHARAVSHGRAPHPIAWAEIAALVAILLLLIAGAVLTTTSRAHAATVPSCRVLVESHDTLWTLAAEHPVKGLSTARTADLIAQMNEIHDGRIAAGTMVRVPLPDTAAEGVAVALR